MEPTRITKDTASCIDNIFSNDTQLIRAGAIAHDISDHLPIFVCVDLKADKRDLGSETRGFLSETGIKNIYNDIKQSDLDEVIELNDPNKAYDKLVNILEQSMKYVELSVTR